ncbi:MAG: prolipoprotein diacylglyceryl transferase [Acidobacteria bacterium]|nr:prolipoprotein diacylglyceryl transferase [Acidobacteriota bacterium]
MSYSQQVSETLCEVVESKSDRSVGATVLLYILIFWVALPSFLLITGFRLGALVPVVWPASDGTVFSGWACILVGSVLMAASSGQLWRQGKGLPISHLPPTEFVARGIYRYLRHPIYVGYTLAFAGVSLLLGSFWSLTFSLTLLLWGWIGYVLFYEEPELIRRFGERYLEYRRTTALLLPKRLVIVLALALQATLRALRRPVSRFANWTIMLRRGRLILVTYGTFVTLGALIFMQWTSSLLIAQGVAKNHMAVLLVGSVLSVVFFARLFWWLGNLRTVLREPLFGMKRVGFVSFGAFAGLIFFAFVFAGINGYSVLMIHDAVLRGAFAAAAIGRLGCLTYGCCYGVRSRKYGILYRDCEAKVIREQGMRPMLRHPTQAYSFLKNSLLFVLLNVMAYKKLPAGFITAAAFLIYPMARTFVELLRDRRRYLNGIFTDGHISCAAMFLAAWLLLFFISPSIDAASPQPLTVAAIEQGLVLLPLILSLSIISFIVTSLHWKNVGTL